MALGRLSLARHVKRSRNQEETDMMRLLSGNGMRFNQDDVDRGGRPGGRGLASRRGRRSCPQASASGLTGRSASRSRESGQDFSKRCRASQSSAGNYFAADVFSGAMSASPRARLFARIRQFRANGSDGKAGLVKNDGLGLASQETDLRLVPEVLRAFRSAGRSGCARARNGLPRHDRVGDERVQERSSP